MSHTSAHDAPARGVSDFRLTPQQVAFFETFGFLRLPGLFGDEIEDITASFEEVFASEEPMDLVQDLHFRKKRLVVPHVVDKHPRLGRLLEDPRITGIASSLLGEDYEWLGSDGNLMWCGTAWHCDVYNAPLDHYHVKVFFYLDPVDTDSGGLRMLPGTNFFTEKYATTLRRDLWDHSKIKEIYGVDFDELPSVGVPSEPGDVIVGNFRTIHATFHGGPRRRLFTLNFREANGAPPASTKLDVFP